MPLRSTPQFKKMSATVGEVDDFVLQEFLTDLTDNASTGPNAGVGGLDTFVGFGGGFPPTGGMGMSAAMFNGGNKNDGGGGSGGFNPVNNGRGGGGDGFGMLGVGGGMGMFANSLVGGMGSGELAALLHVQNVQFPLVSGGMLNNGGGGGGGGVNGGGGGGVGGGGDDGGGGAQDGFAQQQHQHQRAKRRGGASQSQSQSRAGGGGGGGGGSMEEKDQLEEEDTGGDPEVRRKRQREANLQAQRRCRERHRNHVTNLEKEVQELRNEVLATRDENKRLQLALQNNLSMIEECQKRWDSTNRERDELTREKDELKFKMEKMVKALQQVSVVNSELETKLKNSSPTVSGGSEAAFAPPPMLADVVNVSLHEDAAKLIAKVAEEREAGAAELSNDILADMKGLTMRLTAQFRMFLVDGNACSSIGVFSVLSNPETATEPGAMPPCAAMMAQGPGQPQTMFKLAHGIARELDLTDEQRMAVVQLWQVHSQNLNKLFDRRKKLAADALVLQGTSPVATLVDFVSIGSGVLSGGIKSEEEMVEKGGIMTLTGFASHACRVEQFISELRDNIGAEQKQNFFLVTEIVDDVLTPFQTCKICSMWPDAGCPDMLAVSRAITVQSMQLMPQLMQQQQC